MIPHPSLLRLFDISRSIRYMCVHRVLEIAPLLRPGFPQSRGKAMQIQEVFHYFGNDLKKVEDHMEIYLRSEVRLIPEIIHHLIGSGGKRFRPLLLLATAELCGYRGSAATRCRRSSSSSIPPPCSTTT